jgi:nitroreductase
MNLYNAITNRKSIRKYSEKQLDNKTLQQIKINLQNLELLNPNINVRLELITEAKIVETTSIGFMGGMIKINAPHCIVGITEYKNGCMENIGFILEQAVLKLQNEGIGTCWLGTYNKEEVKSICNF